MSLLLLWLTTATLMISRSWASIRGIFITTSSFSADARVYAERVNARIVLIDGPELAQLMVEHNCGVRVEETFVLKEVDEDFFDES
jgi:restriction system protein